MHSVGQRALFGAWRLRQHPCRSAASILQLPGVLTDTGRRQRASYGAPNEFLPSLLYCLRNLSLKAPADVASSANLGIASLLVACRANETLYHERKQQPS